MLTIDVDLIEPLGADILVYGHIGDGDSVRVAARLPANVPVHAGKARAALRPGERTLVRPAERSPHRGITNPSTRAAPSDGRASRRPRRRSIALGPPLRLSRGCRPFRNTQGTETAQDFKTLRLAAHLGEQRRRDADALQLQRIAYVHDAGVGRLHAQQRFHGKLHRLAVGVHDHRNGDAVEEGGGDRVGIGRISTSMAR